MHRTLLIPLTLAVASIAGCNYTPATESVAAWVPAAAPSLASIDNHAFYALAAARDHDAYIFEETVSEDGQSRRYTWLVALPHHAEHNKRLEMGSEESFGWLLEEIRGEPTHATPLDGYVMVHHRDAEVVTSTVALSASGPVPTAGLMTPTKRVLSRRIEWTRSAPDTPRFSGLETTSGMPHTPPKEVVRWEDRERR